MRYAVMAAGGDKMKNLLVVPVYNLVDRIDDIVRRLRSASEDNEDILFVDDASADGSVEHIETGNGLFCIRHECELGFGGVMISALEFARKGGYANLILLDARSSNFAVAASLFRRALEQEYEIVNLSRNLQKVEGDEEYAVLETSKLISTRLNNHTGLSLSDVFSPYKAFEVSALDGMTLEEFDESWILQLWIQAVHFGKRVTEVYCAELSEEYTEEAQVLEYDREHYDTFMDGEILLYPYDAEESE